MSKRKSLGKRIRFEVFKRDSFTCQYCGRKAPDVVLEVDHIEPVSKGGDDDLLNLVTSCKDCNSGKGDRRLSDSSALDAKRNQLEDLQERKEQLEMMFEWQRGLLDLDDEVVRRLAEFWSDLTGYELTEAGIRELRQWSKRYNVDEIIEAMRTSENVYIKYDGDKAVHESVELAWSKVPGICRTTRIQKDKPYIKRLYYIRGILRNRLHFVNEVRAMQLMERAVELGVDLDSLEEMSKEVRNWTEWRQAIEGYIEHHGG